MTSRDLDPDQRVALVRQFLRTHNYLWRLSKRMGERDFPVDDPLYVKTVEAERSVKALYDAAVELSVSVRRDA